MRKIPFPKYIDLLKLWLSIDRLESIILYIKRWFDKSVDLIYQKKVVRYSRLAPYTFDYCDRL